MAISRAASAVLADQRKRGEKSPRHSPLYTSRAGELTKREVLGRLGPDQDGAMRVTDRKDTK